MCVVDPATLPCREVLVMSPPCPAFSQANARRGEGPADLAIAAACARFITDWTPRGVQSVFLEQVRGYLQSASLRVITAALQRAGWTYRAEVVGAADYGVPQTRTRLLLRAWRAAAPPPPLVPTHQQPGCATMQASFFAPTTQPWMGWWAALDARGLLDTLPASQFAPWQLARLQKLGLGQSCLIGGGNTQLTQVDSVLAGAHTPARAVLPDEQPRGTVTQRSWLVAGSGTCDNRDIQVRATQMPVWTIRTTTRTGDTRCVTVPGRVVAMTVPALAAFQTFSVAFQFPAQRALACRVIGNAMPGLLARQVFGQTIPEVQP